MLTNQTTMMFESIARDHPRFREWLEERLAKQMEILVMGLDMEQVRKAQGHAQCLQTIIQNLDAYKNQTRRNAGSQP